MADHVAHETENIENQPKDDNCGDVTETVKKPELTESPAVDEAGDATETKGEDTVEESEANAEESSRKRKSVTGDAPDEGEEESKKAKTDDTEVTPTNGSVEPSDVPEELTTKKVAEVQRLDDEEVAA
jgi:hypothetical protein